MITSKPIANQNLILFNGRTAEGYAQPDTTVTASAIQSGADFSQIIPASTVRVMSQRLDLLNSAATLQR